MKGAFRLTLFIIWVAFSHISLTGCAQKNHKLAEMSGRLKEGVSATLILKELEKIKENKRDEVQDELNIGYLRLITGDFLGAQKALQASKKLMKSLQADSASEAILSVTINSTLSDYSGWSLDQVLVHGLLSLNYLMLNDLSGARVEALQADVAMKKMAERDEHSGQLASVRYISGWIYELNNELDEALISYRKAYQLLQERKIGIPKDLQMSLLVLTKHLGLSSEHKGYRTKFPSVADNLIVTEDYLNYNKVIYFDGVISQLKSMTIPVKKDDILLTIVVPRYEENEYQSQPLVISYNKKLVTSLEKDAKMKNETTDKVFTTQLIENVEQLVREDLSAQMLGITATVTARALIKYQLVNASKKENNIMGMMMNIITIATEIADTRSWSFLPSSIQMVNIPIQTKSQDKEIEYRFDNISNQSLSINHQRHLILVHGASETLLVSPPLLDD